jgi:hypothetical protein
VDKQCPGEQLLLTVIFPVTADTKEDETDDDEEGDKAEIEIGWSLK